MNGQIITAQEVKARWAFSEINSDRFGRTYEANLPTDLFNSAKKGVPFDQIAKRYWPALEHALKIARNSSFVDCIDTWGAPTYECVEWQINDLLNSSTLPCFSEVTYIVFLARPPRLDSAGNLDDADPRYKSHRIPYDASFQIVEPLIAIFIDGRHMLIEGYLRSILWLRRPVQPLRVWVPKF